MMQHVDLHTHSTASDGQYSPSELVALAGARGLNVLALTDHDTIDGLEEAVRAGRDAGLAVIRGVELGAKEYRNLHILGYGFAPGDSALAGLCRKMKGGRDERKYRIVDFLREKGVDIPLEEVEALAGGAIIARPHFAQVMVRRGYVSTNREAFDRYLDTEEYQKIERTKPNAAECIRCIRSSGGVSALAHPYQLMLEDSELERLVRQLKDEGLEAIECYYPMHTAEQTTFYLHLAQKFDLHITGGSDFHGERIKPDIQLATWLMELNWLLSHGE